MLIRFISKKNSARIVWENDIVLVTKNHSSWQISLNLSFFNLTAIFNAIFEYS